MDKTRHLTNHHPLPQPPPSSFKHSPFPAQLDLYTIPTQSCWFSWDSIHETERAELREFFDNTSFTRSVKIYKEYRDFIISKYREEPSRRLTFTELRKSLVGDVCVLRKVFNFLDKWGLINFIAPPPLEAMEVGEGGGGEKVRVRVEEGAPFGVRVVGAPGLLKPLAAPVVVGADCGGGGGKAVEVLTSYCDVFTEEVSCGSCMEKRGSKYYECAKDKYQICVKCFEKGAFGEDKVKEDFKINGSIENSHSQESAWTEAETLLLLESVLKNGDNWELVAQNVQTKTKQECISRLIELPFGELMLGSRDKYSSRASIDEYEAGTIRNASVSESTTTTTVPNTSNNASQLQDPSIYELKASGESGDGSLMKDDQHQEVVYDHQKQIDNVDQQKNSEMENGGDTEHVEPPLKKSRIDDSDPSRSLMEQVALISSKVSPQITAAAANAAVTVLSDGNPLVRDIFYNDDHTSSIDEKRSGNLDLEMQRALTSEDTEMKDASHSSEVEKIFAVKETIPLALQTRAAVGTALGAAAAHARLLADHEEKKIEHLVAFVIGTQLKKMECKIKLFEDVENLMQKEHTVLEESKDAIIAQRLDILQRIIGEGIPRVRDSNSLRPTIL